MYNNKSILVTGGTGSFANAFIENVLKKYKKIKRLVIFSRDEYKQFLMAEKFSSKKYPFLRYYLGDVRDKDRVRSALEDIDYVIHTAALKQVPKAEYDPIEYVKTNIIGSQNIIECSIEQNVKKVIALSTDKAAAPINLYGATKLCSDKLFISANNIVGKRNLSFSIVRYGNVAGSRGSVIPYFKSLKDQKNLPITDVNMTRFWITLDKAVEMVHWTLKNSIGGEIFVPKIPSFRITDLAKAIDPKSKNKIVGIRPGEKIHEDLISKSDSISTYDFGKYYCILPGPEKYRIKKYNKTINIKKIDNDFNYNSGSNTEFLNIKELEKLVDQLD
jgi:UDP-N-acetylglucosamine 4,6-dehydratase/5-epimerase